MQRLEQDRTQTEAPSPTASADSVIGDPAAGGLTPRVPAPESPWSAAGRMLELAAVTADRLATEAETNAQALVSNAQAEADAILEASRHAADRITADSARSREAQAAELAGERAKHWSN